MSKEESFLYPDGVRRFVKPTDGQICEVPSHKKGKVVKWEYNEDTTEWTLVPKSRTSPDIISNSKKILKIAEFKSLRPAKKYWNGYGDDDESYYESLYGMGAAYPYGRVYNAGHITDTYGPRSVGPSPIPPVIPMIKSGDTGSFYVSCECGAVYTDRMHDHYEWCPRHSNNIRRY